MTQQRPDVGADLTPPTPQAPREQPRAAALEAAPVLEPARDIGWLITVLSAVGALFGSAWLFPPDAVGMWAGYWVTCLGTLAVLGAMWLRTYLPTAPGVAVTALAGGVLLVVGAARDYPTAIIAVMVGGGAGIVLGALLQARPSPRAPG